MSNADRLLQARLIAVCFVIAVVVEIVWRPLSGLLTDAGVLSPSSTRRAVIGTHDVILLALALIVCLKKVDWPLIFAPRAVRATMRGILLALPFLTLVAIAAAIMGRLHSPGAASVEALVLVFAASALYVAVAEELLLRGWLQQWLERRLSPRAIVWLQGTLFAVLHLFGRDINLLGAMFYFLGGAVLTMLVFRWRTVWVPVGVHFAWDAVAFPLEGLNIRGERVAGFLDPSSMAAVAIPGIVALLIAFLLLSQSLIVREVLERRRFSDGQKV